MVTPGSSPPSRPEYTYEEWNLTFAAFLDSLARDFGLVQATGGTDLPQLMWFWHAFRTRRSRSGRSKRPPIRSWNTTFPRSSSPGSLTVLVIYPGLSGSPRDLLGGRSDRALAGARREELARLGVQREFLLTTISAFDWEIPAPWKGFAWHPSERSMHPVE